MQRLNKGRYLSSSFTGFMVVLLSVMSVSSSSAQSSPLEDATNDASNAGDSAEILPVAPTPTEPLPTEVEAVVPTPVIPPVTTTPVVTPPPVVEGPDIELTPREPLIVEKLPDMTAPITPPITPQTATASRPAPQPANVQAAANGTTPAFNSNVRFLVPAPIRANTQLLAVQFPDAQSHRRDSFTQYVSLRISESERNQLYAIGAASMLGGFGLLYLYSVRAGVKLTPAIRLRKTLMRSE